MPTTIIGAGLAGLTLALALARQGLAATLLEAAPTLSEAGAGIQLSPNATRRLRQLDLLEAIESIAVRPSHLRIRRARDGADLAVMPLGTDAETRYGAPFLLVHRADLQAILLAAVQAHSDLVVETGVRIDDVALQGDGVTLGEAGGGRRVADGLVGADGIHSRVRGLTMPEAAPLVASGRLAWRSLVPAAAAPPHARVAASNLWLGSGAHLVHYPVRGGHLVNVVAITGDATRLSAEANDWAAAGDPARIARAFAAWSEDARAVIAAAPDWRVWPLYDRVPMRSWSRGPVTLVGDAAHPMLPFLAQGAAQAIEDAAALAGALGTHQSFNKAATAYEHARWAKASRVQRESRRQAHIYHLRPPASLVRDAAFRLLGPARMLARYDWLYGT